MSMPCHLPVEFFEVRGRQSTKYCITTTNAGSCLKHNRSVAVAEQIQSCFNRLSEDWHVASKIDESGHRYDSETPFNGKTGRQMRHLPTA